MGGQVALRPFTVADVTAHNAGEDSESVRWLTDGHPSTVESTTRWIEGHEVARREFRGEQVFAVELDGELAGMVAANLDHTGTGLCHGEINISYMVQPWARRRGVARRAVDQLCVWLAEQRLGSIAVIRVDQRNHASVRTALACGFTPAGSQTSPDGEVLDHYRRILSPAQQGPR